MLKYQKKLSFIFLIALYLIFINIILGEYLLFIYIFNLFQYYFRYAYDWVSRTLISVCSYFIMVGSSTYVDWIDLVICAELRNKRQFSKLFLVVIYMGSSCFNYRNSRNIKDGNCSKYYPKNIYFSHVSFW